jgi:hypothetical protein
MPSKPVKKAAAALSVGVGHFSDPWNMQGISHFLEHMLFMGSEKFPDENDYDAYLTAQGGMSNACTEEASGTGLPALYLHARVAHRILLYVLAFVGIRNSEQ